MNKRDAKALGRWCDKHDQKYERIHLPSGAQMTGCPACADEQKFRNAMNELVEYVKQHYGTGEATWSEKVADAKAFVEEALRQVENIATESGGPAPTTPSQ